MNLDLSTGVAEVRSGRELAVRFILAQITIGAPWQVSIALGDAGERHCCLRVAAIQ